ncbi:MAG: hypothetical protein LBE59_07840 [Nevskiaceae bacterium]|jgi:outer membrane murein-binding lipoprotein Lpp|nr:hypothetical protein [Nevskiaceae bacterium]
MKADKSDRLLLSGLAAMLPELVAVKKSIKVNRAKINKLREEAKELDAKRSGLLDDQEAVNMLAKRLSELI